MPFYQKYIVIESFPNLSTNFCLSITYFRIGFDKEMKTNFKTFQAVLFFRKDAALDCVKCFISKTFCPDNLKAVAMKGTLCLCVFNMPHTRLERIYTLQLPECQENPLSKQARLMKKPLSSKILKAIKNFRERSDRSAKPYTQAFEVDYYLKENLSERYAIM